MAQGHLWKTGIVGIEGIEDALLTGLVTGDPLLLIGPPGCGKTAWVERVAHLLGYEESQIGLYSSPTINFEDVVGIPIPTKARADGSKVVDKEATAEAVEKERPDLAKKLRSGDLSTKQMNILLLEVMTELNKSIGQMSFGAGEEFTLGYASTPTTIWDKKLVLWDELNRTKYDMQNQVLQVIRDRRCSGIKLDLHFVLAAMNELHEKGTKPLDSALADRFALLINFPSFKNMKGKNAEANKLKIATNRTTQDSVMLGGATNPDEDTSLMTLLKQARQEFFKIDCGVDRFVVNVVDTLNGHKDTNISGRRVGMIYRNITAMFALQKVRDGKAFNPRNEQALTSIIYYSLPMRVVTGEEIKEEIIKAAVAAHIGSLYDNSTPASKFFSMNDPIDMIIGAATDKEVSTDKQTMGEILNSALQHAQRRDKDEYGTTPDKAGVNELAISFWAILNPEYFDKSGYERAVSTFNGIEGITRTRGWELPDDALLTYSYAVNASQGKPNPEGKDSLPADRAKFAKMDGFADITDEISNRKRLVNLFIIDGPFMLLGNSKFAKEFIAASKKIVSGVRNG